jgi:Ca2+-binding RTX toxin-like protein
VLGGTPGNDILIGSEGDDTLWGDGGNDRLDGGDGNDQITAATATTSSPTCSATTTSGRRRQRRHPRRHRPRPGHRRPRQRLHRAGNDAGPRCSPARATTSSWRQGERVHLGNEGDDWIENGTADGAAGDNFDEISAATDRGQRRLHGRRRLRRVRSAKAATTSWSARRPAGRARCRVSPASAGEIILGGDGSDVITGRGGDDIIDGDKWLDVQIGVFAPGDTAHTGTPIALHNSMKTLVNSMFSGLINPGQLAIVRTIRTDTTAGDIDTAAYRGALPTTRSAPTANGRLTVTDVAPTRSTAPTRSATSSGCSSPTPYSTSSPARPATTR